MLLYKVGIVSNRRSASDYDADVIRAKSYGIDAFALNIGVDPYSEDQLRYAYQSAANHDMKVFISFDFNWYSASQAVDVATMIKKFGSETAQLKIGNKVFVSSFNGDQNGIIDLQSVRDSVGVDMPLYLAPNFHPYVAGFSSQPFDGALNWQAWDGDGYNRAPRPGHKVTTAMSDKMYLDALGGKDYIARKSIPHHISYILDKKLSQRSPPGSQRISAAKYLGARISYSRRIFYGFIGGMKF